MLCHHLKSSNLTSLQGGGGARDTLHTCTPCSVFIDGFDLRNRSMLTVAAAGVSPVNLIEFVDVRADPSAALMLSENSLICLMSLATGAYIGVEWMHVVSQGASVVTLILHKSPLGVSIMLRIEDTQGPERQHRNKMSDGIK